MIRNPRTVLQCGDFLSCSIISAFGDAYVANCPDYRKKVLHNLKYMDF